MGRSETFEHTADLGLRVFATDLADLFRTAAEGLFDVIVANRQEVQVVETELVSIDAESADDLLLEWLNELIFLSETEHWLYTRFEVAVDETALASRGNDRRRANRPLAPRSGSRGEGRDSPWTEPPREKRRLGRRSDSRYLIFKQIGATFSSCRLMNSSASARVKTPAVVPTERTQLAPTALASFRQSSSDRPSSSPTM